MSRNYTGGCACGAVRHDIAYPAFVISAAEPIGRHCETGSRAGVVHRPRFFRKFLYVSSKTAEPRSIRARSSFCDVQMPATT